MTRVTLGGVIVDLSDEADVHALVAAAIETPEMPALAIASANLDHINAFALHRADMGEVLQDNESLKWLILADGMPLLMAARHETGRHWPRLAGADLLLPILVDAAANGNVVGFLGGTSEMHDLLNFRLQNDLPSLKVGGYWAPTRAVVDDPGMSAAVAGAVASAEVEILVVGLGKPRQEQWIQRHAARTNARVLLAFGAAPDFLAGVSDRAPEALREHGLEWAYRLAKEPRRLARRYLVEGPPAVLQLVQEPCMRSGESPHVPPRNVRHVAVVIVTYNNRRDIGRLLDSIPAAGPGLEVSTIVVDNGSTDGTTGVAARAGVTLVKTGRNLGYAGAINVARRHIPQSTDAIAILNPDLVLGPDSLAWLAKGLHSRDVGVCVPKVVNPDGTLFPSLHREPTVLSALGEATFGDHWAARPSVLSDTVRGDAQYDVERSADWASGAAWMVAIDCERAVGAWDESFFLYSEELDYARRVRDAGYAMNYLPEAVVEHAGAGSGSSPDLHALMTVNQVRDYERHHGRIPTAIFRTALVMRHLLRSGRREDRRALAAVVRRSSWSRLPSSQRKPTPSAT